MSKCWYCNNELTTGYNPKHFGICNKCYDEMFKSSDTIISSFTNKISDLEAKLAESESKRKSLEEKVKFLTEETEENFVDGQKYNELREQKDKEIQDLKQQLEETEEERDGNYENYSICWKDNEYLKQQLEEKEKEIEQLKKFDDLNRNFFAVFRTAFKEPNKVDDLFNTLKTIQEKHNQDKISFAVEQLEKVKKDIDCYMAIREGDLPSNIECLLLDFADKIDNQIKELKGE